MSINSEADAQAMLDKLRAIDEKLNQPTVLFLFEYETDLGKRKAFNEARLKIATFIGEITNQKISDLLAGLKLNESSLLEGIENLNSEIETANDTARILHGIENIVKILTAIF